MRPNQRANHQMRPLTITRHFTKHAEGSVLISVGETKVLCTASLIEGVPRFLRDQGKGWLTAEYGMLPRATHDRVDREAVKGKQTGRTIEIQRLIGRALRAAVDLKALGENTLIIDCDVLQADGGTRTAAINGACVAVYDALNKAHQAGKLKKMPFKNWVSAISVGILNNDVIVDLEYTEDSTAETDMNIVMLNGEAFIEIQGTAEKDAFNNEQLQSMLDLAKGVIAELLQAQKNAVM